MAAYSDPGATSQFRAIVLCVDDGLGGLTCPITVTYRWKMLLRPMRELCLEGAIFLFRSLWQYRVNQDRAMGTGSSVDDLNAAVV